MSRAWLLLLLASATVVRKLLNILALSIIALEPVAQKVINRDQTYM